MSDASAVPASSGLSLVPFTCGVCNKAFATRQQLGGHQTSHKQGNCPHCGRTTSLNGLGAHMAGCPKNPEAKLAGGKGRCPECHKVMQKTSMIKHLREACPTVKWKMKAGIEVPSYTSGAEAAAHAPAVEEDPTPVPAVPVPEPKPVLTPSGVTDDDLYVVLDMLAPNGFKAKDLALVADWMQATRNLIDKISQ